MTETIESMISNCSFYHLLSFGSLAIAAALVTMIILKR